MRYLAVLLAVVVALILAFPEARSQSFSRQLFSDRFDPAGADVDGDGVRNDEDRCYVYTLTDNPPLLQGCTALDLMDRPFKLVEPLRMELARIGQRIQGLANNDGAEGMRLVALHLGDAMYRLNAGAHDVAAGQPCTVGAPVGQFRPAISSLDEALVELRFRINEAILALPDTRPGDDYADHTNEDLVVLNMQIAEADLAVTQNQAAELSGIYDGLCLAGLPSVILRDTIKAYDPGIRRALMTSGVEVAVTSGFRGFDDLYPGRVVDLQGLHIAHNSLFATTLTGFGSQIVLDPSLTPSYCAKLRFVPVQRHYPFSNGPYVHHAPGGYLHSDGRYYVEAGSGFVADTSNCPSHVSQPGGNYIRYGLVLELDYTHVQHGATSTTLAFDLHSQYTPVHLPSGISPGIPATLTVKSRYQTCYDPGTALPPNPADCSEPQTLTTTTLALEVKAQGDYCQINYESTVFDLEDSDTSGFRRTRVSNSLLIAPFAASASYTFRAEGYASSSPGHSSYPAASTIIGNNYFAIHQNDFYKPGGWFSGAYNGVDKPSGLRWPRLLGSNAGGLTFSYSCKLPTIVRDAVAFCQDFPHAFYRLPFSGGHPTWIMGQGNDGEFTHNGKQNFAYDFIAPTWTPIRAARGGTIVFVRKDQTGNSYYDPDCDCNANALVIRHQDGSEGAYFHMPLNGVSKDVGALVKRGDLVAMVGNTGYSTTAHLHFQEQLPASGGTTTASRFQAYSVAPPAPLLNCWVPQPGQLLYSNNDP